MSNNIGKKVRILTDVVMPYNTWYRKNYKWAIKNIDDLDIPHLVEKTIAKLGNHKVVNEHGFDLSDGSEIKTCSILDTFNITDNGKRIKRKVCFITNVASRIGSLKTGALRVVVYNQFTDEVRYFFLPKKVWRNMHLYNTGSGYSIKSEYNITYDTFNSFSTYEVENVRELATAINC